VSKSVRVTHSNDVGLADHLVHFRDGDAEAQEDRCDEEPGQGRDTLYVFVHYGLPQAD
jgi:hypothetical protein